MNIFEQASRNKIRFTTTKGMLTVEDLWDLPLTSNTGKANLDDIARTLYQEIKESQQVSFVTPPSGANESSQLAFDVVKHIIDVKIAERDSARAAADRKAQKDALLEVLAQKENEELRGKSAEEIRAMIAAL